VLESVLDSASRKKKASRVTKLRRTWGEDLMFILPDGMWRWLGKNSH
jgi:hypothetical protein